ncbi:MAG: amidohydrolase family protein [Chloroflexota bacterium]|nr:amidohydrolase family protein [Chloroflexota bacterium]
MSKQLCISGDSHIVEPPEFFEPLIKVYGDKAPHMAIADPAMGPQMHMGNGKIGLPAAGFLQQNVDYTSPKAKEDMKRGYDLALPGCYNVAERLKEQDQDGIDAEVLYPSLLFNVYQVEDLDILKATFNLYNDWITDYVSPAPDRLFALGALQMYDLDQAITEMERCKSMGHVGVCIPATAPPDHLYIDPWYDKFWAAAQDMKMSLNMHIFTGATDNHGLAPRTRGSRANGAMAFAGAAMTIADIIQSGVTERFPELKIVITEFETGWIAHLLKRLDWAYIRGGGERVFGTSMMPSHYWKRNFYATFEDDPIGIMTRDWIGSETLIWGNDYPHGDSVFPHSQQVLNEILSDCTPEERWQMTVKNVVELYNLPFKLEGPEQALVNSAPPPTEKTWRGSLPGYATYSPV